jgi:hypothetical protein
MWMSGYVTDLSDEKAMVDIFIVITEEAEGLQS